MGSPPGDRSKGLRHQTRRGRYAAEKEPRMAEKKITVVEKFAATIAVLKGEAPEIDFTVEDAVAFMEDRLEKANRKAATPTVRKVDPEVEEFRRNVAAFLAEQTEPVAAKVVAEAFEVSTQKASAALRALAKADVAIAIEGAKPHDAKTYVLA